jgi:PAS domain S-box-containing protein
LDISPQGQLDAGRGQYIVKFPSKIRYAVAGCPFQPWRADTRNKVSTHNLCEIKAEFQLIRKMQFGFGLVLAILFIVGGLSYRSVALSRASDKSVEHTHEVLENLERLLSAIQDIESSDRTLALTGDAQFLYLYRAGVLRVSQEENTLRTLTADNPNQGRKLVALARLTDQKIQFGETLIRLRQTEGQEVAIQHLQGRQGIRIMEEIRAVIRDMEAEEHQLLSKRDAQAERRSRQARFVLVAGSLLGLFIASGAGWTIRQGLHSRARVEEALQGSDEKYRMLIDGIQDYAIYMLDPDGQIISWNAGAERIKGYTAEQIIGQNFSCFYPPDEIKRGKPAEVLRMTAASGRQEEQGMRVRKDGSRFLANVTLTALRDRAGNLRGYSEFSHDLSESKESGARYRGLLEAAPDAMVVVNQGGEIVLLNVQAEKQFGYRRDELLGQKVKNIIPEGFAERLIADGTRSAADALAQQIGTGIELSGRRKDGTEFPIEIMLSPLESAEGILVTAAIRDISVRKDAERNLAQMEGRYRGLLEAAPDAMVVVNQGGEIVLLNVQAEKQFGYRRDELLGQQVKNIIPEGFAERLVADALRSADDALAQQIGTGIELSGRRKDRSEFPIEIMLSPLEGTEGVLVTAAIRDITRRKNAEATLLQKVEELNRSNEELGQFANIASHDLQEPLRMVASYTQLLSSRYKGKLDADADEFIAFAVDGATRMQRLIQDLLAYSRVGSKGRDLLDTSSEKALQQALLNLSSAIKESGALVTHDPLPTVQADEMQLVQLFQNLIGNGIKYQRPGVPQVHISAAKNGAERWIFSVRDNGLGIDSQYFEKIFGMFQRLHKREEFAGTGIGLAICKKIVERHGGNISVESKPGRGSTFRFALAGSGRKS